MKRPARHPTDSNAPQAPVAAPWSNPRAWSALNQAFSRLIEIHDASLSPARAAALRLANRLGALFLTADRLSRATCRYCPDPCCGKAWAWFDFKDLLFIHLCGFCVPEGQTLSVPADRCRYLGHRGCRLPRMTRPWVCTWYICPTQAARMKRLPAAQRRTYDRTVAGVKEERNALEALFIRITAG